MQLFNRHNFCGFKDLNTALDEALESFDLASTNWLEGKGGRGQQQQQQPADGAKK